MNDTDDYLEASDISPHATVLNHKPVIESESHIISYALRELAATIKSDDGIANGVCAEAADRIDRLEREIDRLKKHDER